MLDINSQHDVLVAISPVTITDNTAQVGATIDLKDYVGINYIVQTGTLADADATFAVKLFEGDASDMSDEAEVTDSDLLLGTKSNLTFADDGEAMHFGYRGNKRYTRIKITPSNNTGSTPLSACAVVRKKKIGTL